MIVGHRFMRQLINYIESGAICFCDLCLKPLAPSTEGVHIGVASGKVAITCGECASRLTALGAIRNPDKKRELLKERVRAALGYERRRSGGEA